MRVNSLVAIALLFLSCKTVDAALISGEVLATAGEQFLAVNEKMQQMHDQGKLDKDTFAKWEKFAEEFKTAYVASANLWQVGTVLKDNSLIEQAGNIMAPLFPLLNDFTKQLQELLRR